MKGSRYALVGLLALAVSATAAPFKVPSAYGTEPSRAVHHWIKYLMIGPQTQPFPIVWISPQRFEIYDFFESLTVLSHRKYEVLGKFTEARISQADCSLPVPHPPPQLTVQISEYVDGRTQTCVIPRAAACHYVSDVLRLPNIDWKPAERKHIDDFAHNIRCDGT
jgi:hypothetical protein